ncbi:hypothetical protein EON65_40515 [archaeon]|nr:MAG: hypothetical protein EON65_40515 [archaeon]
MDLTDELPEQENKLPNGISFDPASILSGPVIRACPQVSYQGHACTAASVEQATEMIDYISQNFDSEDCAPFAIRLVEAGELLSLQQDNGEFMCASLVGNALKRLDGYNAMLCVTRKIKGCFVDEMVYAQKRGAVKIAAEKAADLLLDTLNAASLAKNSVKK